MLKDVKNIALYATDRDEFDCSMPDDATKVDIQVQITGYWDYERSVIRWILLDFQATGKGKKYYLCINGNEAAQGMDQSNWEDPISVTAEPFMKTASGEKLKTEYTKLDGDANQIVETDGALRRVVRTEGDFVFADGDKVNRFIKRVTT